MPLPTMICIYTKLYVFFYPHESSARIMTSHWAPAFEDPGGAVAASAQRHRGVQRLATLLAATEKARCAAARLNSEGREDLFEVWKLFPQGTSANLHIRTLIYFK